MARMILRIEDELLNRFKEHCKDQNKTVSEVIRSLVHTSLNGVHTNSQDVHTNSQPVHTTSVCTDDSVHTPVHTSSQLVHTNPQKVIFDPYTGEPLSKSVD